MLRPTANNSASFSLSSFIQLHSSSFLFTKRAVCSVNSDSKDRATNLRKGVTPRRMTFTLGWTFNTQNDSMELGACQHSCRGLIRLQAQRWLAARARIIDPFHTNKTAAARCRYHGPIYRSMAARAVDSVQFPLSE